MCLIVRGLDLLKLSTLSTGPIVPTELKPARRIFRASCLALTSEKDLLGMHCSVFTQKGHVNDPVVGHRLDSRRSSLDRCFQVTTKSENNEFGSLNLKTAMKPTAAFIQATPALSKYCVVKPR
jgi:hypothetical protein